jgi:hypothetical protein
MTQTVSNALLQRLRERDGDTRPRDPIKTFYARLDVMLYVAALAFAIGLAALALSWFGVELPR